MKFIKDWKSICWGLALIGATCILFMSLLASNSMLFFGALGLFLIVAAFYTRYQVR